MLGYGFCVGNARLWVKVTGGLYTLKGENAAGEVLLFGGMGLREPVVVGRRCEGTALRIGDVWCR